MKNKILSLLFLLLGISTYAQKSLDDLLEKYNKNNVPYISVTELRMLQSRGDVVIIDSREKNEFEVSHLSSAIFVGYNHFNIKAFLKNNIDKETPIVVYCTLGIRSEIVANKLIKAGYTNVKNLYGGICEWKNKGYRVLDSTNHETENVHTFSKQWGFWLLKGTKIY